MIEAQWTNDLDSKIYKEAKAIRFKVFVDEQQVPEELEIDDLEADCQHLVLYKNGQPIATTRIYERKEGVFKIQRVAVYKDQRGHGYGALSIHEAEEKIQSLGGHTIQLGAQIQALPFYEKLGYTIDSDEYLDAGILHYDVIKFLN